MTNEYVHQSRMWKSPICSGNVGQGDPKPQGLPVNLGLVSHAWAVSAQGCPKGEFSEALWNRADFVPWCPGKWFRGSVYDVSRDKVCTRNRTFCTEQESLY